MNRQTSCESVDAARPQRLTKFATKALFVASAICIALGVYLRCNAIDRKYLWYDEISTQMFVSNHLRPLSAGKLYTRKEVLDSIRIDQTSSAAGVVSTIWKNHPEQAPLFFVGDYIVCRLVKGDSLTKIRIFSIFCGILVIPTSYLFASRWLDSKLAGLVTAAMVAVSPFCLEMSLQAKPYALWALLCLLTIMALLKALQKPTKKNWVVYGISLLACVYTHFFTVLAVAALAVVSIVRRRNMRFPVGLVVSTVVALLMCGPWLSGGYPSRNLSWLRRWGPVSEHLSQVAKMLVASFCEFCQDPSHVLALLAIVAIAVSIAIFVKRGGSDKTVPLMLFVGVYLAAFVMIDLIFHRSFAASNRYLTPALLALTVMLGGANLVWTASRASWEKLLVLGSTFSILGVGICSSMAFTETRTLGNEVELPEMLRAQHNAVIFVTGKGVEDEQNTLYQLAYRPLDDSTRFACFDRDSHVPVEDFDDSNIYDQASNQIRHYHRDRLISQCEIAATH